VRIMEGTVPGRVYRSHQQAIGQLFQIGLAATSLHERTADPYVQEQLLGMVTDLDQVIAALRSMTFDLVPDSHNSQAALELVAEPPGSERL
jgi:hypothetical protein